MRKLRPYFPVFKFVAIFGGLYFILSILYSFYLQYNVESPLQPDSITIHTAHTTALVLEVIDKDPSTLVSYNHPSLKLYLGKTIVYRVIEGCNAVSVMILFASFILAFSKTWLKTLGFILCGILVIYITNILRLVLLAIIYADYPQYKDFSHNVLFPAIIYGTVIIMWLYWIRKPKKV